MRAAAPLSEIHLLNAASVFSSNESDVCDSFAALQQFNMPNT